MKIKQLIIDEKEIKVYMAGYGCNSNSHSDEKVLKIKHNNNLEATLKTLGVELI